MNKNINNNASNNSNSNNLHNKINTNRRHYIIEEFYPIVDFE